jgi:uncharacterized membrane protein (DUF373 family)
MGPRVVRQSGVGMTDAMKGARIVGLKLVTSHTQVHHLTRHLLEPAQDMLVLAVGLALFGLMVRTVASLFLQIFRASLNFREVIAEVLFMLVMVEVVRLVIIYLGEHRVAVDFMVELGIVATLREIVLRGVTDLAWQQVIALTVFLLALGALLRFGDLRTDELARSEQFRLTSDAEASLSRSDSNETPELGCTKANNKL